MKRLGALMGYQPKDIPTPVFEKIQVEDVTNFNRIIAQLSSLGILTPAETFSAMEDGLLPTKADSEANQEEYVKQRDKQMYFPLVGGSQESDDGSQGASAPNTGACNGPSHQNRRTNLNQLKHTISIVSRMWLSKLIK